MVAAAMTDIAALPTVGSLLRDWRQRRRMSQLDLALEAGVSARHLSFIETGRSRPSADMVLHLAEELDVPLRERNQLLLSAGYAPAYAQRDLDAPEMGPVRQAIDHVRRGRRLPGVAPGGEASAGPVAAPGPRQPDVTARRGGMGAGNQAVAPPIADVAEHLLDPPVNVLRVSLHPEGMAPRILNLAEWRGPPLGGGQRPNVGAGGAGPRPPVDEGGGEPGPPGPPAPGAAGELGGPPRPRPGGGGGE